VGVVVLRSVVAVVNTVAQQQKHIMLPKSSSAFMLAMYMM